MKHKTGRETNSYQFDLNKGLCKGQSRDGVTNSIQQNAGKIANPQKRGNQPPNTHMEGETIFMRIPFCSDGTMSQLIL